MIQILGYLRRFWQKDFNGFVYGCSFLMIFVLIFLNYHFDFEDSILDSYQYNWWAFLLYFINFSIPYFFIIFLYRLFLSKDQNLFTRKFYFKSFFAIALIAFKVWFFYHQLLAPGEGYQEQYLYTKISNRFVNIFIYIAGILAFYKFFEVDNKNYYGFANREFNWKPYFLLLAFMVPLILWASFQPDFLEEYPQLNIRVVKENYWKWFTLFEPLYLFEFVSLEWFFRGFLVVGMIKILGHRAVLPMAILYCVFHFGKPMGECIGSLFGGYILGVISYYTRSIWGGVVIHMGVAFLMDTFALLSHFVW